MVFFLVHGRLRRLHLGSDSNFQRTVRWIFVSDIDDVGLRVHSHRTVSRFYSSAWRDNLDAPMVSILVSVFQHAGILIADVGNAIFVKHERASIVDPRTRGPNSNHGFYLPCLAVLRGI